MFSATADIYDLIYRTIKDFRAEAANVAALVRQARPSASTLLDVACGTGEHIRHLRADHAFRADGLDLERRFVELAQARNPDADVHCADMVDFDLGRQYDAVVCLFGSIGYVVEVARLGRAVASMARHVAPEGLLIIEPWFEPGVLENGRESSISASANDTTVRRTSHLEISERISRVRFEYVIGTRDGVRREYEIHQLGLFTRAEMESAFRSAGCEPEYRVDSRGGRGFYLARRRA